MKIKDSVIGDFGGRDYRIREIVNGVIIREVLYDTCNGTCARLVYHQAGLYSPTSYLQMRTLSYLWREYRTLTNEEYWLYHPHIKIYEKKYP